MICLGNLSGTIPAARAAEIPILTTYGQTLDRLWLSVSHDEAVPLEKRQYLLADQTG